MAEIASAWVSVALSAKGIQGQIQKEVAGPLAKAGGDAGDKAGQAYSQSFTQRTRGALEGFSTKALGASVVLGAGLFKAADAASSLEAALGANVQVLGEASSTAQDFAKNAVESVGLSERAALEASTRFGQLGKIIGLTGEPLANFSTDLITLAADMAAFADVPIDVAIRDVTAAFQGSTETVSKYGVFLNETALKAAYFKETGEEVTGTLTAQQRIIATNAALWEQTADIQGQAAREAGSLARAQDNMRASFENASAKLGAALLPSITRLVQVGTNAVDMFARFNDATGGVVGTLAGFSAVGLGVVGVAGKVSAAVRVMGERWRDMGKASKVGIGVASVAMLAYTLHTQKAAKESARFEEGLVKLGEAADAQLVERFMQSWAEGFFAVGSFGQALEDLIDQQPGAVARMLELEDSTGAVSQQLMDSGRSAEEANTFIGLLREGMANEAREAANAAKSNEAAEEAIQGTGETAGWASGIFAEYGERTRSLAEASRESAEAQAEAAERGRENAERLRELFELTRDYQTIVSGADWGRSGFEGATQALGIFNQYLVGNRAQVAGMEASMDGLSEALKKVGEVGAGGLDDLNLKTEEGRAAFSALQDVAAAWQPRLAEAIDAADGNVDTLSSSLTGIRGDFVQMAIDAGIGADEANALADAIGLVPENAKTLIELSGHEEAMVQLGLLQSVISGLSEEARDEIALHVLNDDAIAAVDVVRREIEAIPGEHQTWVTAPGAIESAAALGGVTDAALAIPEAESVVMSTPGSSAALNEINQVDSAARAMSDAESVEITTPGSGAAQNELNQVDSAARGIPTSWMTSVLTSGTSTANQQLWGVRDAVNSIPTSRTVWVNVATRGLGGIGAGVGFPGDAYGAYHPGGQPELRWVGDASWDEATLTVGNRANLARQMRDPKILNPILSVLPLERGGGSGGQVLHATIPITLGSETITREVKVVLREAQRAAAQGSRFN